MEDQFSEELNDIKEEVEHLHEEQEKYILKLTWKNLWVIFSSISIVVGAVFGAGIKVQTEYSKMEVAKINSEHLKVLSLEEGKQIKLESQLKQAQEEINYHKYCYILLKKKLDACNCDLKEYQIKNAEEAE